ncbi:transmembrane protein 214-a [Phtheirospermum japonicum]|uniref:Transmembrane protein 214-a n=1 Tax=Phtheirospermum japonicum TaxID=374723 RepID=A0A830C632_9LAMI|nr:transmembrane protein 214-a [Phtheirospermum japonicum]
MEEDKSLSFPSDPIHHHSEDNSHGWQKVTYAKKQRKNQANKTASDSSGFALANGSGIGADKSSVFKGLEQHAEERRRKLEAQRAAAAVYDDDDETQARSRKNLGEDNEDDYGSSDAKENNPAEANKKEKPKKVKKLKVTVAEAAAKIDAEDLAVFLSGVSESFEGQQDIQLKRFADYFGRAFSAVSASQFPWLKLFRESAVAKIADVPVSYISESVYKTSVEWISKHSNESLGAFVLWSLDGILADLATQLPGSKGTKKGAQQPSSKSQVAIFLVLAIVLRRKPDVLISILPNLRENSKYQGQDKLPLLAWMVVQACQGDLALGLYFWAHLILPILGGKSGSNPQSRDLVLQLVERVLGAPKARGILINGAVRKGERLIPPAALELLLRVTFPTSSARVKATERFEAVYPTLKDVALAGSPGSKAMKQVSLQIQTVAVKAAGEGIPALSQEATSIFLWCLTQSPDCYKQWDKIYEDNIEASVVTLKKLSEQWKTLSPKQSSLQALAETLKSFRQKNAKALSDGSGVAHQDYYRDADKYCKTILGRLSSGHGCLKAAAITIVVLAVGAAVASPDLDAFDWNTLSVLFKTQLQSFGEKFVAN